MKNEILLNKEPNKHEILSVTISYHSAKLGVFDFLKRVVILCLLRKICCFA